MLIPKAVEKYRLPPGRPRPPRDEIWLRDDAPLVTRSPRPNRYLKPNREPKPTKQPKNLVEPPPNSNNDDDVDARVAPANDERWAYWALPFIAFLRTPREWNDIFRFGSNIGYKQYFTRNIIAWLSFKSFIDPSHDYPFTWKLREDAVAVE